MNKLIDDYNRILKVFAPLTKMAEETQASVSNFTNGLEELKIFLENDSGKNVIKFMEYAKRRNINKKVRERIEVWL